MANKKPTPSTDEISRVEVNKLGEEELVTYRLGPIIKRVKIVRKEKPEKKEKTK